MNIYLKFSNPSYERDVSFWKKTVMKTLSFLLPMANPDFDKQYSKVKYWFVECDEDGIPQRELGFNNENKTLVAGPWENNLGFWTDNNILADFFIEKFNAEIISQELFEDFWKRFKIED